MGRVLEQTLSAALELPESSGLPKTASATDLLAPFSQGPMTKDPCTVRYPVIFSSKVSQRILCLFPLFKIFVVSETPA